MNSDILTIKGITKRYPGVVALNNVSFNVRRGEVHALIGENGAGKSTLIKAVTGAIKPDEGEMIFEGVSYQSMTPALSQEVGIAAIYQEFTLAPALNVAENIFMGQKVNQGFIMDHHALYKNTQEILNNFHLNINPKELVRNLTVAYKQLVEIGKAIAKNAKLIIMDEPTAPLTDDEVDILMDIIKDLKSREVSIIYISHRLDELYRISDRVTVMRDGEVIITKDTNELSKSDLIYYMVGRELKDTFPARNKKYGKTLLEVKNLQSDDVAPISFSLKEGEILGLAGLVGAGRTELARLIFGADKKTGGEIYINGEKAHINSPRDAVNYGIGLVAEDRKNHGVLLRMPISKNITLPILKRISNMSIVNIKKEKFYVDKEIKELSIRTPSAEQLVGNLSGGNQQKVVLGKWLASDSKILILDEPTRGIDVGAKQEIYKLINTLAESGIGIIVISSEMEEILGLTDRMLILYEGKFMTRLEKEAYSQERVLQFASGENSI